VLLAKLTFANARSESEWLVIRAKLPTTPVLTREEHLAQLHALVKTRLRQSTGVSGQ